MDDEGKAWMLIIVGVALLLCASGAAAVVLGAIGMIALVVLCCLCSKPDCYGN